MEKVEFLKNIGLMHKNYQGELVPAGAGIIFVIGGIVVWMVLLYTALTGDIILEKLIFLTTITGSAGLLDDMQGTKNFQGFNGHLNGIFKGVITTGILKAIVIFTASFIVIFTSAIKHYIIIDVGILVLMSHFHNLLDLRPGRTIKFFILYAISIIFIQPFFAIYLMPLLFIMIFYIYFDLKAKVMLGDTGSYTLGIIAGFLTVKAFSYKYKLYILIFLIILTFLSEKYSFSTYIKKNRILNWLDMLGR